MTQWIGTRPEPDFSERDWAERITKVAIERDDDETHPWHLWGRDYQTGLVSEEVWDFPAFRDAVAAIPDFFALYADPAQQGKPTFGTHRKTQRKGTK